MVQHNDLVQRIRTKTDIVDVARSLGIEGAKYKANICCPLHDDSNPSFRFYLDDNGGNYKCFSNPSCYDKGQDVFGLVQKYKGCDFKEALSYLSDLTGIKQESERVEKSPLEQALDLSRYFFHKRFNDDKSPAAKRYAATRFLSLEAIEKFDIGFAPRGSRLSKYGHKHLTSLKELHLIGTNDEDGSFYDLLRNRITFPIHTAEGKLMGFSGRVLDDSKPKYLNSPESPVFKKSKTLYNIHRVPRSHDSCIVVEGYLDVIGLWQSGISNAVGTMGVALCEYQLNLLMDRFNEVIFMFDGDKAGKDAAWGVAKSLIPFTDRGVSFRFMFLQGDIDPFDLARTNSKESILELIDESIFLSDFIINESSAIIAHRRHQPELVHQVISRLESFLNQAPESIFRDTVAYEISELNNVPIRRIPSIEVSGELTEDFMMDLASILQRHSTVSMKKESNSSLRFSLPSLDDYPAM
jgi:DNA primase